MADPLLVHVHVPKCAGTTIETHLKSELGSERMWAPSKRSRRFPPGWFSYKYDPAPEVPTKQVYTISGHFIGQSIEKMFPERRISWKLLRRSDLTQRERRLTEARTSLDRYLWRRWAQTGCEVQRRIA